MHTLAEKVYPINALPAAQLVDAGIDAICHSAELKTRAVVEYYSRVEADVTFFFSDIAIQAEAMGAVLAYGRDFMPSVASTAAQVSTPRAQAVERMRMNRDVLVSLGREFPGRMRAGMVYGPFTVAGQVAGEQDVLRATVERPAELLQLLDKTLQVAQDYARLLLDTGIDILWVSDPLAALLPPEVFDTFAGEQLGQLFKIAQGRETVVHICGDTGPIVPHIVKTGVSGISFDQCMSLLAIEDRIPEHIALIGNLDPVDVLELGTVEVVEHQTRDLIQTMGPVPNFSLSSGCAPPPSAPLENMSAFVRSGKETWEELCPHKAQLEDLSRCIFSGKRAPVPEMVRQARDDGAPSLTIIRSGLMRAVRKGSALYEERRCHLPAILLMVDAFYDGFNELEKGLDRQGTDADLPPQLIIGTVRGDIHEMGKNLVRLILQAHGYRVRDMGVNVPAEAFVEAAKEAGQATHLVVGLSAFVTSARRELVKVMELLKAEGLDARVILGGAAVNRSLTDQLGAAGYAKDAVAAVKLMERLTTA